MVYNTTNITSANNIMEMFVAVNQLTDGIFVSIMMLVLFIVIFVVFSNNSKRLVLLVDSFVMSIIGVLLFVLGMIGWPILIAPILVLLLSILFYNFIPE